MPPIRGTRIAYNRLNHPYEHNFDGRPYTFAPHEQVALPAPVAEFLRDTSMVKWNPVLETYVNAIVLDGEPGFEEPYDADLGAELVDRTDGDYVVGAGASEGEGKLEVREVKGAAGELRREMATKPRVKPAQTMAPAPA